MEHWETGDYLENEADDNDPTGELQEEFCN